MKITREINGKKMTFKLTERELCDAYFEAQDKYDIEDVKLFLENFRDDYNGCSNKVIGRDFFKEYGMSMTEVRKQARDIAQRKRSYQNNNSVWDEAIEWAIKRVAKGA